MRSIPGWAFAWGIVGVVMVVVLAVPGVSLPSDDPGWRRFQTPEVSGAARLSQTFTMTANDFHAIEFLPISTEGTPTGDVSLELYDAPSARLVRRAFVRVTDLVRAPSYRFAFAPIPDSQGKQYRLDVVAAELSPPRGLALLATKGARYSGGAMLINETERWADLAFRTFSPVGLSGWTRLSSMPASRFGISRGHVILMAFAVYWFAFGLVLRALWRLWDSNPAVP